MWAALPEQVRPARMATLACRVLFSHGVLGVFAEAHRNCFFTSASLDVRPTRSMTRLTTKSLLRSPRMGHDPAHGSVLEAVILVLVAGDAGLASYIISSGWSRGGSFCLFLSRRRRAGILGSRLCAQADRHAKGEQKEKSSEELALGLA